MSRKEERQRQQKNIRESLSCRVKSGEETSERVHLELGCNGRPCNSIGKEGGEKLRSSRFSADIWVIKGVSMRELKNVE